MRLFAKTIKASTLNSPQKTHPDREERVGQLPSSQTDSYAAVAARRGRSDSTDLIQIKNMLKIICDNLLDIPSKPQDFLFFRDLILPISSLIAMGLSKWFSSSFVVILGHVIWRSDAFG